MCSRARAIEWHTGDSNGCFHPPFGSFIVLPFINNGSYFLYYSAAAALFITACNRCLESRDKHEGTALRSAMRGLLEKKKIIEYIYIILCFSFMVKLDLLSNTFLLLVFTKPSLKMNLLKLQCIYIFQNYVILPQDADFYAGTCSPLFGHQLRTITVHLQAVPCARCRFYSSVVDIAGAFPPLRAGQVPGHCGRLSLHDCKCPFMLH